MLKSPGAHLEVDEDETTVVPEGEAAIITTKNMTGELTLHLPKTLFERDGKDTVPPQAVYLAACAARADDHEFVAEMLEWFKRKSRS